MRDHTGSREIDFAVLLSIVEHYANRHCFTISDDQPFRIHFLIVAPPNFGKSVALEFGFTTFLRAYHASIGHVEQQLLNVSGQNTAAGLMDEFNRHNDAYSRQVALVYAHEAPVLFGGRRNNEIVSLFNNVLAGRPNFRFIREKSKKGESILNPVINAILLTTPVERNELRFHDDKSATSTTVPFLDDFLLVAPKRRDRSLEHDFAMFEESAHPGRIASKQDLWELFGQFLNFLELKKGTPSQPRHVQFSEEAFKRFSALRHERLGEHDAEDRIYYTKWWPQVLRLAALNALMRMSLVVSVSDVEAAWNLVVTANAANARIQTFKSPMVPQMLKFHMELTEAVIRTLLARGRAGATRTELRQAIPVLHAMAKEEIDGFFARLDDDENLFSLPIESKNSLGVLRTATHYFSTRTWTPEQAVLEVAIPIPKLSSHLGGYVDARGETHQQLKDCFGYRTSWEAHEVVEAP